MTKKVEQPQRDYLKNLSVDFSDLQAKLDEIVAARSEDYGDFELNMLMFTRVIEAMATQALQMKINLPDSFGARVMSAAKMLRQCHKHKQDNVDDRINYDNIADRMDGEKSISSLSKLSQVFEKPASRREA